MGAGGRTGVSKSNWWMQFAEKKIWIGGGGEQDPDLKKRGTACLPTGQCD